MEVIVLGASGSFSSPETGPCSGYLLETAGARIWMDCGHGTFRELQRYCEPGDLSAIVVTHEHADHCADLTDAHIKMHFFDQCVAVPLFAPEGVHRVLERLIDFGDETFDVRIVADGDAVSVAETTLRFARTDHSVETLAVEVADATGARLIYSSDTGPAWSPEIFAPEADLVIHEASYLHAHRPWHLHCSAHEAGVAAKNAGARALMLTHRTPGIALQPWLAEGSAAFGRAVLHARSGARVSVMDIASGGIHARDPRELGLER
ncbi:MAG: MBL fold metallo-hydrolase [Acidimicrobiia bacterium]